MSTFRSKETFLTSKIRDAPANSVRASEKGLSTAHHSIHDERSVSTYETLMAPSIVSYASSIATTASSIMSDAIITGRQRLAVLFYNDTAIKSHCSAGLATMSKQRFERNFVRLIKIFGADLQQETSLASEIGVAKFIRKQAFNITDDIIYMLNKDREEVRDEIDGTVEELEAERSEVEENEQRDAAEALDTEDLEGEENPMNTDEMEEADQEIDHLIQFEHFIRDSRAWISLKESLQAFMHPPVHSEELDIGTNETSDPVTFVMHDGQEEEFDSGDLHDHELNSSAVDHAETDVSTTDSPSARSQLLGLRDWIMDIMGWKELFIPVPPGYTSMSFQCVGYMDSPDGHRLLTIIRNVEK